MGGAGSRGVFAKKERGAPSILEEEEGGRDCFYLVFFFLSLFLFFVCVCVCASTLKVRGWRNKEEEKKNPVPGAVCVVIMMMILSVWVYPNNNGMCRGSSCVATGP